MTPAPVGIFDSGIGGLSVAREVRRALPREHLLYVADTAYVPYGDRTTEEVRERSLAVGRYLEAEGAKALVVACNTASGAALETLREHLRIPVIGVEPAVKPAVAATRVGKIGVMATAGTVRSERFARLLRNYADGVQVVAQGCPGLADLIEDGVLGGPELRDALEKHVAPLREAGVDVVVLGCTHYPFVVETISEALGPGVQLIESGEAIARRTARVLDELGALEAEGGGSIRFLTTGSAAEVRPVVERLWGGPIPVDHVDIPGGTAARAA